MKTLIQHDATFWEFDTKQSDLILEIGAGFFSESSHMQLYKTKNNKYVLFYPPSREVDILSEPEAIKFYYRQTRDLDGVRKVFKQGVPVI